MWPEDLFEFILEDLTEEIAAQAISDPKPMPCDRWIARSALQKAIRRGEPEIALQALAALLVQHPAGLWRDLTIIAIEDVGVPGMDTIARVVSAGRNRPWRRRMGGEWVVASALVQRMAEGTHCQAVCDLLMRLENDPAWDKARVSALEADIPELARDLVDSTRPLEVRAAAALALGGGLAEEQRFHQPTAIFEALGSLGRSTHVVATAQAAWKISRNPMALLLPLVWLEWMKLEPVEVRDDDLPALNLIGSIPTSAIDQFTRAGQSVIRAYLNADPNMRALLDAAGVLSAQRSRVVGDLMFLLEGGIACGCPSDRYRGRSFGGTDSMPPWLISRPKAR